MIASGETNPWDNVELTEEEADEAIRDAKRAKYHRELDRLERAEWARRRDLFLKPWTPQMMYDFLLVSRAPAIGFSKYPDGRDGRKVFVVDQHNRDIIKALCYYFTNDPGFEALCRPDEAGTGMVHFNWKLKKGLLLAGSVGVGKTEIMKLFSRNKRACYDVVNAREFANEVAMRKDVEEVHKVISQYSNVHRIQVPHIDSFYHEQVGLCFDDLGTDTEKNIWGNKLDILADVIAGRYANNALPWHMTHLTTNLSAPDLEKRYGPRIWSRMVERFNVIEFMAPDRRMEQEKY